jgi:hypothetical protein
MINSQSRRSLCFLRQQYAKQTEGKSFSRTVPASLAPYHRLLFSDHSRQSAATTASEQCGRSNTLSNKPEHQSYSSTTSPGILFNQECLVRQDDDYQWPSIYEEAREMMMGTTGNSHVVIVFQESRGTHDYCL